MAVFTKENSATRKRRERENPTFKGKEAGVDDTRWDNCIVPLRDQVYIYIYILDQMTMSQSSYHLQLTDDTTRSWPTGRWIDHLGISFASQRDQRFILSLRVII